MASKLPIALAFLLFGYAAQASFTSKLLACAVRLLGVDARQQWLADQGLAPRLPASYPMSYAVNHRYAYYAEPKTIFSSIPHRAGVDPSAFDFAKLDFSAPVPTRFIVGEGENYRALIGVDLSPGSPLSIQVERIRKVIEWSGARSPEEIVRKVSENISNQLGPIFRSEEQLLAGPAMPWDQPVGNREAKVNVKVLPVHHAPIPANFSLPVVPLEKMVARAEAYCMGQALLAWIVLRSYGIPCRPLFGANWVEGNHIIGHTSVELEDGRIVDPAGWVVIPSVSGAGPRPRGIVENWRFLPNYLTYPSANAAGIPTWRFRYERYLGVVLQAAER